MLSRASPELLVGDLLIYSLSQPIGTKCALDLCLEEVPVPPTTGLRPFVISGEVLRRYEVATLEDVDAYLVGLKTWLVQSIEERPAGTLEHIYRYSADVDKLLDRRIELMLL